MGGVGISSTPSLQQSSDLEKTQAELRQTFNAAEKFRRELEFLQKGGDPLDLKPGNVASISFQSTSLTERHSKQLKTSEAKGSFVITASPHGDSVESSGRLGAPSVCEPNSADNLMLLKESGESAVLELPKKSYKRRIRSHRPNRDYSRHVSRDFKGPTHDADNQEWNYLLNSNSNPKSPDAIKNSNSHIGNELDGEPAVQSTLGPARGPHANALLESHHLPLKSDSQDAFIITASTEPKTLANIIVPTNGNGNAEEMKSIPDTNKILDEDSSCKQTGQHCFNNNGNGNALLTNGPMEPNLEGVNIGAKNSDEMLNIDPASKQDEGLKGPETAKEVGSDGPTSLKTERKSSVVVGPDSISQDGHPCNNRPQGSNESRVHEECTVQNACSQDTLKLAIKEREDSILEEARIIEAKRKGMVELPVRTLSIETRLKSQWDFVLEEMSWLANDFAQERLWKVTAAAQISRNVAFASRLRFQQQSSLQKHKEVSHALATAVMQFWDMIQAKYKGAESYGLNKDRAVGIQEYAARFLEYNSSLILWNAPQTPASYDNISDLCIMDRLWEDNLTEENLFYTVPPGAIEAYRKAIDSHLLQFERTGSSMQEEVDTSGYDAAADNAFEEDEGETSTYYMPGVLEGIKSTKNSQKGRKNFKLYGPRPYDMGGDPSYMQSVERAIGTQPSVLNGKRSSSSLNVTIPTKRVRTASRQRIISPFNAGSSGQIHAPNRTDGSSGDNNSFQDEQSNIHVVSQIQNNMEAESMGEYEKQLQFDSMEVSNRPKKRKKEKHPGSTFENRWQLDSNYLNEQKDHSRRRLDPHQFDSNGSSVASQMSNMSNQNKFIKSLVRDRSRKVKAPKTPVGQPGSGNAWSLFEDQALVVLVHDMGPNWELISDAINSTLQFKCIFRKAKDCKERHKILMDRNTGDGADSAEDSGSSQPYPSTLPGIPEGSARQLFQRLQGPMEEDTLKSHFEKIIVIGQKQHYRRMQVTNFRDTVCLLANASNFVLLYLHNLFVFFFFSSPNKDNQDPKQLQQPHSSHAFALSQVHPNNLNNGGRVLTPLDLCEAVSSSPDVLPVGYQGPHSGGFPPGLNHGPVPPVLPGSGSGSGSASSAPSSSNSVHGSNPQSVSAPFNPSHREGRYGIPRTGSSSADDQQRIQQYNQMLSARNAQQPGLPPGSHSVTDRTGRILPAGNGMGPAGINRNPRMARPGYQGIASTSTLSPRMATPSSSNMHSGPRPRDPMHMIRPNNNIDHQVTQSGPGPTQGVPTFSGGPSSSFPNQLPQQPYPRPISGPTSPLVPTSNSPFQGHPNHYAMRLAKERQLQQQRLLQQQQQFSTSNHVMPHVQQQQPPPQESSLPVSSPQNSTRSSSPPVSMGTPSMTPKHPAPPHGLARNPQPSGNQIIKQPRPRPPNQFQHMPPQQRQQMPPQQQAKLMKAARGNMMMNQNLPTDSSSSLPNGFSGGQFIPDEGSSQGAEKQSVPQSSLSQTPLKKTLSGKPQKPSYSGDNKNNKNHASSLVTSSTSHHKLVNQKQANTPQNLLLNRKAKTSDQSTSKQAESPNSSQPSTVVPTPRVSSDDANSTEIPVVSSSAADSGNPGTQLSKSYVQVSSPQTNHLGTENERTGLAVDQDTVHRLSFSDSLPNPVAHDASVQQQQQQQQQPPSS
ncbi:chromatin modification-related protein EAF1 A-like isoform X2 [Rutidosis leptorrhynchoides]|uniref:chromatin modification-related protein EAF1 A-like isoform X2 n=1 Tax=Rutidosis leptorrhynchoides TaxID=125765 RepID=UPI003A9A3DB7